MKIIYTFLLICFFLEAQSQIIYTDIADMVLSASPTGIDYDLDVDANMVNDFKVNMIGDISNGYGNFVAGSFSSMNGALMEAVWGDAMHLSVGDSINASALTWSDFTSDLPVTIFVGGTSYGQEWLVPVTDGYFGFKFEISGGLHYGWMRMDVEDATIEMTIKDWAYNSVPDEYILAGQTSTATGMINNSQDQQISLTQSDGMLYTAVQSPSHKEIALYDLAGKLVVSSGLINNRASFSISGLNTGIYIVYLNGSNDPVRQKVFIDAAK
jgi:hypothetical protein